MSTALSNYLGDSVSLASTFTLERYGSRILAQYINDGENEMVTFVETCVRKHRYQPATGHRIPEL